MSIAFAATDSAIPSPGVTVFRCPACNNVETDNTNLKLKISIGFPVFLCCAICSRWQEVLPEIQLLANTKTPSTTLASSPVEFSMPIGDHLHHITDVPSIMKVEDAADEQMSQDPNDSPISDSGSLVEVPRGRDEQELTTERPVGQILIDRVEIHAHDGDESDSHPSIPLRTTDTKVLPSLAVAVT